MRSHARRCGDVNIQVKKVITTGVWRRNNGRNLFRDSNQGKFLLHASKIRCLSHLIEVIVRFPHSL